MATPQKCPYCHVGEILWIKLQASETTQKDKHSLRCSQCNAMGEFADASQPDDSADGFTHCPECGIQGGHERWCSYPASVCR